VEGAVSLSRKSETAFLLFIKKKKEPKSVDNEVARAHKKATCEKSRKVVQITIENVDNLCGF